MNRFLGILMAGLVVCSGAVSADVMSFDLTKPRDIRTETAPTSSAKVVTPPKLTKRKVSNIFLRGNTSVKSAEILAKFGIKKGDTVTKYQIQRGVQKIRSLGVFSKVKYGTKRGKYGTIIYLAVTEYPVIGHIAFEGNELLETDDLLTVVKSKAGEHYNVNTVRHDISALEDLYKKDGYMMARVQKVLPPLENDGPMIFQIAEGDISEIVITGNTKTEDQVIRRELQLKPGMALNQKTIQEDLRRVFNLNFFTQVQPDILPGVKPNTYRLVITVEEKLTTSVNFGGGYGQSSGLFGYTDLNMDNFFGTGRLVFLRAQFGRANSYQFKYRDPWAFGAYKSFEFKLWHTAGDLGFVNNANAGVISFRNERRTGIQATVGWPISYEWRTSHSIKSENISIIDDNDQYNIRSYTFGVSYDTRDNWMNPTEGDYDTLSIEKAFKFSDPDLDFTRYDLTLNKFVPTTKDQTIAMRFSMGVLTGPDSTRQDGELYYVGGSNSVRGYGDLDPFANGTKRLIVNLEYRWIINPTFTALVFLDAGYASYSLSDLFDVSNYKLGKGAGVRVFTPLGPLRLDVGFGDVGTFVHFNIGHVF